MRYWTTASIRDHVPETIDIFIDMVGIECTGFGSNFPADRLAERQQDGHAGSSAT